MTIAFTAPRLEPAAAAPEAAPAAPPEPSRAAPTLAPPPPGAVPVDFVTDAEHPVLPIPFRVELRDARLEGTGLSVASAYAAIPGALDASWRGHKEIVRLRFAFEGFELTIPVEAVVAGSRRPGEMTLQFLDPTGPHLPQLRHVLNAFIAGDLVGLGGLLSYSGPVKPKAAKAASDAPPSRRLVRSAAVAFLSLCLLVAAANFLIARATQTVEPRPVIVEREGRSMMATAAGQIAYLNPEAGAGEVVFSVNANSGDVLNFQLPCDCQVAVTDGIFEGATVLPEDVILSFFNDSLGIRAQTLMSIEGLASAMSGDRATLNLNDGRSIPVQVVLTSATSAAMVRGDEYVPVYLAAPEGALVEADVGKAAQLILTRSWFPGSSLLARGDS